MQITPLQKRVAGVMAGLLATTYLALNTEVAHSPGEFAVAVSFGTTKLGAGWTDFDPSSRIYFAGSYTQTAKGDNVPSRVLKFMPDLDSKFELETNVRQTRGGY